MQFEPGTSVAFRDIRRGVVHWAWPARVVEDGARGLITAQRPGAVGWVPRGYPLDRQQVFELLQSAAEPELVEASWSRTITLGVSTEGAWWATRLFWDAPVGTFLGYYVDFVIPMVRRGRCLDFVDLALDVVVDPGGGWRWKDVDEYEAFQRAGIIDRETAGMVEAARPQVILAIESKAFPFDDSLLGWQWPNDMATADLPDEWSVLIE